jgi:AcrR family transcriptional regulator
MAVFTNSVSIISSSRRQRVIDAAAEVFSQLGYHGASTRAIADKLGIKSASLYFHISSKEHALEEVCSLGIRRAISYLDEAEEKGAGLAEKIRHFFFLQSQDFVAHADYLNATIHEGRYLTGEAKLRVAALSAELRAKLDSMFEQARARGELHGAITPQQARFVMSGAIRSISEIAASGRPANFDQIMPGWTESIIRGFLADPSDG